MSDHISKQTKYIQWSQLIEWKSAGDKVFPTL